MEKRHSHAVPGLGGRVCVVVGDEDGNRSFFRFLKNKRLPYFEKISASSKLKNVRITNVLVNFLSVRPLIVSISNIHEDNNGAIVVASSPRVTPTLKHIIVKYNWFCKNVQKKFVIQNKKSYIQKIDIFTKGLQNEFLLGLGNFHLIIKSSYERECSYK